MCDGLKEPARTPPQAPGEPEAILTVGQPSP